MLTGESIPVIKNSIDPIEAPFSDQKHHIIYAGSRLLSHKNMKGLVIRTSFETLKGNLIRCIIYPQKLNKFSFKADSYTFIIILAVFALLSFLVALPNMLESLDDGYTDTE